MVSLEMFQEQQKKNVCIKVWVKIKYQLRRFTPDFRRKYEDQSFDDIGEGQADVGTSGESRQGGGEMHLPDLHLRVRNHAEIFAKTIIFWTDHRRENRRLSLSNNW